MAGLQITDALQTDTLTDKAGTAAPTATYGIKADTISEKTSAAGVTADGVLHKDGGVQLATSGGTPSSLAFYQEYSGSLTFTPNGAGSTGATVTIKITRAGNMVTIFIPRVFCTCANNSVSINSGPLPTWAQTTSSVNVCPIVSNNNVWLTVPGQLLISTAITLYRDSLQTAFSNAANTGFEAFSASYLV